MIPEIFWLSLALSASLLASFPYVLNRIAVRGLGGTIANPAPDDAPLAAWAQRAQRAHANAIENLAVFAPAVLAVAALHRENEATAAACATYVGARLLHYLVYTWGIPGLRTAAFLMGWGATAVLIARTLGAL
jgi:uncharacterized MAPEG superfamily protein